eukprot:5614259-Pyramimonas_sp.AAC.1
MIARQAALAHRAPQLHTTILTGDFNIADGAVDRSTATSSRRRSTSRAARPGDALWRSIFHMLTELGSELTTHWDEGTQSAVKIDRLFTSTPSWILCQTRQLRSTLSEPQEAFLQQ